MATRGLYKFYDNVEMLEKEKPNAVIYRHWDNYLEGGGLDLLEFLQTLRDTEMDDRFQDSPYLASKFVVDLAMKFASDWKDNPLDFLSVGIVASGTDHWEEYTYHIVSELDKSGLPKVFVDSYEYDKEDLISALEKESLITNEI